MSARTTFLVDNGSLAPAATLQLRRLADVLSARLGEAIEPVSLLHSSAIPAEQLEGRPAEIFETALARRMAAGAREFLVLPLFFGPSRALTNYLPERVAHWQAKQPQLCVRVAPPLFATEDRRLAEIVADNVRSVAPEPERAIRVALVDHGSPVRAVTEVRDSLAQQLAEQLGARAIVAACSMERRPEPAYDFNEPLLETLLARDGWNRGRVIVAMQFLLAGRHAGPDGDVAQICRRAESTQPGLVTQFTPLVGEHPKLIEILADRWRTGWASAPLQ